MSSDNKSITGIDTSSIDIAEELLVKGGIADESSSLLIQLLKLAANQSNVTTHLISDVQDLLLESVHSASERGAISEEQRSLIKSVLEVVKKSLEEHRALTDKMLELSPLAVECIKKQINASEASE